MLTPLEDPTYQPAHPPLAGGAVPPVVEKWGPRSQLRWFRRYLGQIAPRPSVQWNRWHCESVEHKGLCCPSCMEDQGTEWAFDSIEGKCCCYTVKMGEPDG